jgi:hypothetical protein
MYAACLAGTPEVPAGQVTYSLSRYVACSLGSRKGL